MLVLANATSNSTELLDELRGIGATQTAKYLVVVPDSPIDTGVAASSGPLDVLNATQEAAQARGIMCRRIVQKPVGPPNAGTQRVGSVMPVGACWRGARVDACPTSTLAPSTDRICIGS